MMALYRALWLVLFAALLVIGLAACGAKGEEEVVGDLSEQLQKLEAYQADVELVLHADPDQEPHRYELEVWHKGPDYYRVSFTNQDRDVTQIILKNEDGVFVLTPHLNKSFRFQSGWPDNQRQVYLYESILKDIMADSNRVFEQEEDQYVIETEANYQNHMLNRQKVWLTEDLKPSQVHVMDSNYNVLVEVTFNNLSFDPVFADDAFDMEPNMQMEDSDSTTTGAQPGEEKQSEEQSEELSEEQSEEQSEIGREEQRSMGTYYPAYLPGHVELVEEQEVQQGEQTFVVLRYAGDYHFTLIQQQTSANMVYMPQGDPVDLGYKIGVRSDDQLSWSYEGMDFTLAGEDLPFEEMLTIAQSIQNQAAK